MPSVLIVDDDDAVREVIREVLVLAGYAVEAACDGKQALDLLEAGFSPALILLDLQMPVMNGWEFCLAKERDSRISGIPTVVMAGVGRDLALPKSEGVLPKPFSMETLLAVVARSCGARAQAGPMPTKTA